MEHKKRRGDEAEKPFWISYADLMTAMMVLFLVVMVASLSSVTQRIQKAEQGEKTRGQDITRLCERLELHARNLNKTIVVDCHDNRISFGEAGRFDHNRFSSMQKDKRHCRMSSLWCLKLPKVKKAKSGLSKLLLKDSPIPTVHIFIICIFLYSVLNG